MLLMYFTWFYFIWMYWLNVSELKLKWWFDECISLSVDKETNEQGSNWVLGTMAITFSSFYVCVFVVYLNSSCGYRLFLKSYIWIQVHYLFSSQKWGTLKYSRQPYTSQQEIGKNTFPDKFYIKKLIKKYPNRKPIKNEIKILFMSPRSLFCFLNFKCLLF